MPYDPMKEASEFLDYILRDERAQLAIVTSTLAALITAIVSILYSYSTRQS